MMRRNVLAVCAMAGSLAAPALAKDLAASLPGNWVVDKVAAVEAMAPPSYKSATPEKRKEMLAEILKTMPDMVIAFTATTASMTSGTDAPQVATYKVTRQDKGTVWVDLVPQVSGGGTAPAEKFSLEFVDADTVKMLKEGDPAALLLKRSK